MPVESTRRHDSKVLMAFIRYALLSPDLLAKPLCGCAMWTADTVAHVAAMFNAGAAAHCFLRHRLFVKPRTAEECWQAHGTNTR